MKRWLQGTVQTKFKFILKKKKNSAPNLQLLYMSFLVMILTTELSCPKTTHMHISSSQGQDILIQGTKAPFRKDYLISATGSNRLFVT